MKAVFWFCVLVSWPLVARTQGAMRNITFEGPPIVPPDWNIAESYYEEGGMYFTPIPPDVRFSRDGGSREGFPQDSGAYVLIGHTTSLRGQMQGGEYFRLHSVDLAEFSILYPFPITIPFIGYKADGSSVTNSFTTDGIIDSSGPEQDFQTFYFDSQFSDLVRFEVPTIGYALDNLVVSTTREPKLVWQREAASGGVVPLILIGKPGTTYVLEDSTNLVDWSVFATNDLPAGGPAALTNSIPVNLPVRFIRARTSPL